MKKLKNIILFALIVLAGSCEVQASNGQLNPDFETTIKNNDNDFLDIFVCKNSLNHRLIPKYKNILLIEIDKNENIKVKSNWSNENNKSNENKENKKSILNIIKSRSRDLHIILLNDNKKKLLAKLQSILKDECKKSFKIKEKEKSILNDSTSEEEEEEEEKPNDTFFTKITRLGKYLGVTAVLAAVSYFGYKYYNN